MNEIKLSDIVVFDQMKRVLSELDEVAQKIEHIYIVSTGQLPFKNGEPTDYFIKYCIINRHLLFNDITIKYDDHGRFELVK